MNLLIYFFLLLSVFALVRPRLGVIAASAACLFIAGQPNIIFAAASVGMDLASLYLFFLMLVALYFYIQSPNVPRLGLLWSSLIFFSYSRYESIGLAMILYLAVWALGHIPKTLTRRYALSVGLAGVVLFPLICQQSLSLGSHENPEGVDLFSWEHFRSNCRAFVEAAFHFNQHQAFSSFLSVVLVVTLIGGIVWLFRSRAHKATRDFVVLSAAIIIIHQLLMLFHLGSRATHPNSVRFYLPWSLLAALAPLVLWHWWKRLPAQALLLAALLNLVVYHAISVENRFGHVMVRNRETKGLLSFLKSLNTREVIVISDAAGIVTAHDYSAISFQLLQRQPDALKDLLVKGLDQQIYAVQSVDIRTGLPIEKHRLPPTAKVIPVWEFGATEKEFTRISAVTM